MLTLHSHVMEFRFWAMSETMLQDFQAIRNRVERAMRIGGEGKDGNKDGNKIGIKGGYYYTSEKHWLGGWVRGSLTAGAPLDLAKVRDGVLAWRFRVV